MKSRTISWEVDSVTNKSARRVLPILKPIIIRGLQVKVAFMTGPGFSKQGNAQVLAWGALSNVADDGAFGPGSFPDNLPATHGTDGYGFLFSTILKTAVTSYGGSVNDELSLSGLSMVADPTHELVLFMGHGGVTGDMEMQGVIFYEDNTYG
jgi:hypothetical protein